MVYVEKNDVRVEIDCLYCIGVRKLCECYSPFEDGNPECVYYRIVQHDLEKIKKGQHNLTFGVLEEIVKGDDIAVIQKE